VSCAGDSVKVVAGQRVIWPKQSFLGFMVYNRLWFHKDSFGLTIGGGKINNPGRYLVLLPPINGATAASGTPYFTENPGDPYKAWDASGTFDWMPSQYITFRWEYNQPGEIGEGERLGLLRWRGRPGCYSRRRVRSPRRGPHRRERIPQLIQLLLQIFDPFNHYLFGCFWPGCFIRGL